MLELITYSQPLRIVRLARGEQSLEGEVSRNDEAGKVGQELTSQVEDNEEEVKSRNADNSIGLGHTSLLLEVAEDRVLGELQLT